MIIDLKKIRYSGKDEANFCFEYAPTRQLLDLPNAEIEVPVKILGTASLTGNHSAYIDGEITFTISGECTKCLTATKKEYVIAFSEHVEPDNEDGFSVVNDRIDLTEIVDNEILINNPTSFLCKDDCKGICMGCLVNLNDNDCKCEK
jgi:uncharacterized protein